MVCKVSQDKNVREPCCHGCNNKHVGKVREWLWSHKQKMPGRATITFHQVRQWSYRKGQSFQGKTERGNKHRIERLEKHENDLTSLRQREDVV